MVACNKFETFKKTANLDLRSKFRRMCLEKRKRRNIYTSFGKDDSSASSLTWSSSFDSSSSSLQSEGAYDFSLLDCKAPKSKKKSVRFAERIVTTEIASSRCDPLTELEKRLMYYTYEELCAFRLEAMMHGDDDLEETKNWSAFCQASKYSFMLDEYLKTNFGQTTSDFLKCVISFVLAVFLVEFFGNSI